MSLATIVSIYPMEVVERKSSHLSPSEVRIPACATKNGVGYPDIPPVCVLIKDAKTRFYRMEGEWMEVDVIAFDFARSVVHDYNSSLIDIQKDPDNPVGPGIFAIDGSYDREEFIRKDGFDPNRAALWVKKEFPEALAKAQSSQDEWYKRLVNRADVEFNRTRNSRAVSDLHKFAARRLGVEKEWSKNALNVDVIKCPACRLSIDPLALICPNCKTVINKAALDALTNSQPSTKKPEEVLI